MFDFKRNKIVLAGIVSFFVLSSIVIFSNIDYFSGVQHPRYAVIRGLHKNDFVLLTTKDLKKADDVQVYLENNGINTFRVLDGTEYYIALKDVEDNQFLTDRSVLAIVNSDLMDENIHLEIVDMGDYTSTDEAIRARWERNNNAELARLIGKMDGIQEVSVKVTYPEILLPGVITVDVQLTTKNSENLSLSTIKSINNLLLGTFRSLKAENILIKVNK